LKLKKRKDNHDEILSGENGLKCLAATLDTLVLGSDTILTNIKTMMFALAANPDIQHKLRMELSSFQEEEGKRLVEQKHKFPYYEAFYMEVHRFAVLTGFGAPHKVENVLLYDLFHIIITHIASVT
jgi:hypothetical protein